MKLYTELQVKGIYRDGFNDGLSHRASMEDLVINTYQPIELPSDEKIAYEVITWNVYNMTPLEAFRHGVNWTKEQILNQNK